MQLQQLLFYLLFSLYFFLIFTSCYFCVGRKPGFLNFPPPFKHTRSAFIKTLFILFYRFYSFIRLRILIIIIIIISIVIITVFIVIYIVFVISISSFLILLTFIVLFFYHSALRICINQIFLNFEHIKRPKIVPSLQQRHKDCISDAVLVSLMGTLNNV